MAENSLDIKLGKKFLIIESDNQEILESIVKLIESCLGFLE